MKATQIKINAAHLNVFLDADGLIESVYDDQGRDVWTLLYDLGMMDTVMKLTKESIAK